MADPRVCCILGVCCPPNGTEQKEALASYLDDRVAADKRASESLLGAVARIVLELYGTGPHRDRFNEIEPATLESVVARGALDRSALRGWLLEKLASIGRAEVGSVDTSDSGGKPTIDQWLDELYR